MVRRVPGCLHIVCAIWALSFPTKSQEVETVEINDASKEEQAIAKAPKDAESATASNGLEVSALPDVPRALRSTSNLISADLEVGNSLGNQLQGLEAQKSEMQQGLEDSKMDFDSKNHNLADLASQNMQVLMEEIQLIHFENDMFTLPVLYTCLLFLQYFTYNA